LSGEPGAAFAPDEHRAKRAEAGEDHRPGRRLGDGDRPDQIDGDGAVPIVAAINPVREGGGKVRAAPTAASSYRIERTVRVIEFEAPSSPAARKAASSSTAKSTSTSAAKSTISADAILATEGRQAYQTSTHAGAAPIAVRAVCPTVTAVRPSKEMRTAVSEIKRLERAEILSAGATMTIW
jgi:hypothetical protein